MGNPTDSPGWKLLEAQAEPREAQLSETQERLMRAVLRLQEQARERARAAGVADDRPELTLIEGGGDTDP